MTRSRINGKEGKKPSQMLDLEQLDTIVSKNEAYDV